MDEVAESGEEIVITKRGKPVARLAPCNTKPRTLFGSGGEIAIHSDIIEPVDVEWEAESDSDRAAWLAEAARAKLRAEALGAFLDAWEWENGPLTVEELRRAEAELGLVGEAPPGERARA